ncbi:helix-turn-helix transcriptional regulator [Nitrososphaera viennensis]|uniref:Uncharacterized protein n=2 Tax=Nitrososphaera viennensis TaxID=1034015 RepID=A0A977NKU0_9ARCH|nr:hypothetical protein [Nitrososphaera viennensis]UVS67757.1 hypothetical protein NWT39_07515 [Nitrososphaera viennensis]
MVAAILASASTAAASAQAPPPQTPPAYTPDSIFMALFANGDALVEYDVLMSNSTTTTTAASKVKVKLFGTNISELIVTDLDDKILPFKMGPPGEIEITPGNATGARISYLTPDLVNKTKNTWTFTLEAPIDVAIKMPADSVSIDYGSNVPLLSQIGSQTLLTFKAGSIRFSYIIGTLGTEDQADITTKFADASIKQAKASYQGIVLSEEETLLANAMAAKSAGKFGDAIKLATQASDQVQRVIGEYTAAQSEISRASSQISQASSQGRDTSRAASLLDQARAEFSQGKYSQARSTTAQAVAAITDAMQFPTMWVAIIGAVVAGGGAGAYLFFFKKRAGKQAAATTTATTFRDPEPNGSDAQPALEPQEEDEREPEEAGAAATTSTPPPPVESARALAEISESQIDTSLLARIVSRIIEEKPHLRPEDRDVLGFLAEKEGAAFESEVRTRFSLPKTTVWRLVKRLEREELVEIRKAGGQNLIKLRFEGRQA